MSFHVQSWAVETRETRQGAIQGYRVRWTVDERRFGQTFGTKGQADSFRAQLISSARKGEGFSPDTGLPESMDRSRNDVSFYELAREYTAAAWPAVSAKSRISILETLSRVVPVVVRDLAGPPDRRCCARRCARR